MKQGALFAPDDTISKDILVSATALFGAIRYLPLDQQVQTINALRLELHSVSPFASEPVDCVQWVPSEDVQANDYNPNNVAPPEMKLLEHSISEDGYTQPIVAWKNNGHFEVVDGFHRNRVGRECQAVAKRIKGYLPLTVINDGREDRGDRIASTIRHNRARGKHQVSKMSDIVIELKRRNWTDEKIGRELGMDPDEVLRLTQITGLAEMFRDQKFSEAWEVNRELGAGGEILSDIMEGYEHDDKDRLLHTWDKWECYRHGFYAEHPAGMTHEEGEAAYRDFLAVPERFEAALVVVTSEWKHSCEHYLTNDRMNRIAWLGQASVAQALGIPSACRGGYNLLRPEQKRAADELALRYLNIWLEANGRTPVTMEQAGGRTEAELY